MKVVWDEPKRRRNMAKHGLDFADSLTTEFFEAVDHLVRARAGRLIAVGQINGRIVVAVGFPPARFRSHFSHFHATSKPKGKEASMTVKFSSKRPLTDEEEAEIQKMIASDPDNPELTDEQLGQDAGPSRRSFPTSTRASSALVADRGSISPGKPSPCGSIPIRLRGSRRGAKTGAPAWRGRWMTSSRRRSC